MQRLLILISASLTLGVILLDDNLVSCWSLDAVESQQAKSDLSTSVSLSASASRAASSSSLLSSNDDSDLDSGAQLGSVEQPRQYFKLNVSPGSPGQSSSGGKKALMKLAKRRGNQAPLGPEASGAQGQEPLGKQKISSAALKKILSQSLLKLSNGSSSTGADTRGSNFKFVFIQRATAAPNALSAGNKQSGTESTQQPAAATPEAANSLAASVSKQLADSLLISAAGLIDNLSTAAKPSLSAIASQLVAQSLSGTATDSQANDEELEASASTFASKAAPVVGQSKGSGAKSSSGGVPKENTDSDTQSDRKGADKKSQAGKTRTKPSKIYNLPVKFVSNGQPNNVVFSTIKQHLATIKRIQAAANIRNTHHRNNQHHHNPILSQAQQGKRRKQPTSSPAFTKLKGNSRLIYLPLRYLSNAKPNKVLSSKARKGGGH